MDNDEGNDYPTWPRNIHPRLGKRTEVPKKTAEKGKEKRKRERNYCQRMQEAENQPQI